MQEVHLQSLDLNLVRVLEALVRHRSVTRAANELGLSQSATSHALARLRDELGDPLFILDKHKFIPTARAQALAEPLRRILAELQHALSPPPAFDPLTARHKFTIATADYAEALLIPLLVKRFEEVAPGVDLWFRPYAAESPDDTLTNACVVIGPRASGPTSSAIVMRNLFEERFVCVARSGHPALGKRWTPERYASLQHVLIAPRGTPGGAVDHALADLSLRRRVAVGVPNFLSALFAVADSDLVCAVPERLATVFAKRLSLEIVQPPVVLPGFSMLMFWHERIQHDPAHVWMRSQVAEVAADLDTLRGYKRRSSNRNA